jgi:hypothetical protein
MAAQILCGAQDLSESQILDARAYGYCIGDLRKRLK